MRGLWIEYISIYVYLYGIILFVFSFHFFLLYMELILIHSLMCTPSDREYAAKIFKLFGLLFVSYVATATIEQLYYFESRNRRNTDFLVCRCHTIVWIPNGLFPATIVLLKMVFFTHFMLNNFFSNIICVFFSLENGLVCIERFLHTLWPILIGIWIAIEALLRSCAAFMNMITDFKSSTTINAITFKLDRKNWKKCSLFFFSFSFLIFL